MTKQKSTKRALLMSALSLLMCVSMLIGSTFAWFTDSVTSGNNIIKSGNLDIELEYWNGTDWTDVKGASDILTNTLWEPGVTEVAYLRVANAGSLVLKYQLGINILNEIAGKNQAGETFKLSDYIQFGVVEGVNGKTGAYSKDDAGRAAAITAVTDSKKISAGYTKAATMNPNDELYLALVVYMPTDVGNVANHNGTDVPQIDLGINVYATQMTAEKDSFNDQYDVLAGETHYMMNGVNYASFDEAVANATPDKDGVVTYFIGGEAEFSGGWGAAIAPAGTTKVVISGTGADTASLNLAHTYRNSIHADGMVIEISNITIECDPCGTHQDQRNIWVCADELYATNVVFKDPADASNVKKAVFDGCTFASATADEEPSGGNYQLWVGDHDANYGSVTESVVVKNSVFKSGKRAIKLAPTTGSVSYTVEIDNNTFYDITKKPAVCLNYGDQANTVKITNNTLYNTELVEDEVNGNYSESNNKLIVDTTVATAEDLASALTSDAKTIVVTLANDIDVTTGALGSAAAGDARLLGGANTETITVDLNGNELNIVASYWSVIGAKNPDATITFENGYMSSSQASGTWNSYDLTFASGSCVFENITFGKAIALETSAKLKNVTINETHDYYALWITAEGQTVEIDGLTINSAGRGIKIDQQYIADADVAKVTLKVSNATFNTLKKAAIMVESAKGADITIGANVDISNTVDATNAVWVDGDVAAYASLVTVTGGTVITES